MRPRKKSKWVTIVVPCPNCGCGCDVELGGNDDAVIISSDSDSEHTAKRMRLDTPEPEPESEPEPEPEPRSEPNSEPNFEFDPEPNFDSDPDPYANSDDELDPTQTPPSTHVGRFFSKCPTFKYNPSQHIMAEFYRLCASRKVNREKVRQRFRDALTQDFNEMYGTDEDDLGAWQRLCRVLVTDVPDEIEGCRKLIQSRFINIVDLVDTKITGDPVLQFKSEAELSSYTKTTGKYFPNDSEHAGSLLRPHVRIEMRTRKVAATEYTTITVPCPECGCGCDVNLEDSDEDETISISSDSEADAEVQPVTKRPRLALEFSDSESESKPILSQSSTIVPPSSYPPTVTFDSDSDDDIPPWPTTYPKPEPPTQLIKPERFSLTPPPSTLKSEPLTQTNVHQFFSQYSSRSFAYDPAQPIMSEFYRMVDSKDFPKASQVQAKREIEDAVAKDFNLIFGTDLDDPEAWKGLCRVLKFEHVPDDLHECKELVAGTFVNIIDLVDTKISGKPVQHFNSEKALAKYTKKHGKYFPRNNAYSGGLLKFLLRHIHNPTGATRDDPILRYAR